MNKNITSDKSNTQIFLKALKTGNEEKLKKELDGNPNLVKTLFYVSIYIIFGLMNVDESNSFTYCSKERILG